MEFLSYIAMVRKTCTCALLEDKKYGIFKTVSIVSTVRAAPRGQPGIPPRLRMRSSTPRGSTRSSYVVEIGRLLAPSSGHASTSLELDSNESLAYGLLRDSLATAQQRASFVYSCTSTKSCVCTRIQW